MNRWKPNGCGPWFIGNIAPQGPDAAFTPPCNQHDDLYVAGGGWKEKHAADAKLLADMLESLQYKFWAVRYPATALAYYYYIKVLMFGFLTFNFKKG